MIRWMVVVFCFIGGWCYSEWWVVGFENTCTVSGKWNVSRVIPRLYEWVHKTLRLSLLVGEHGVVVMSVRLNPMDSQSSIPFLWNLFSESVGEGIKFWEQVEDSDTGVPCSIIVRVEYLFAFQYCYCEGSEGEAENTVLLIFVLLWFFCGGGIVSVPPSPIIIRRLNLKICPNFVGTKFFLTFVGG